MGWSGGEAVRSVWRWVWQQVEYMWRRNPLSTPFTIEFESKFCKSELCLLSDHLGHAMGRLGVPLFGGALKVARFSSWTHKT